jgi:hypothetical protein
MNKKIYFFLALASISMIIAGCSSRPAAVPIKQNSGAGSFSVVQTPVPGHSPQTTSTVQ